MHKIQKTKSSLLELLRQAVVNGSVFLCKNAEFEGGWSDFATHRSGLSTDWVSAYILLKASEILQKSIVEKAVHRLLLDKKTNGAWGFSSLTPGDCDSTIHALYFLRLRYGSIDMHSDSIAYVLRHRIDGGFSTYSEADALCKYRGTDYRSDFAGWTMAHPCVSSVALELFTRFPGMVTDEIVSGLGVFFRERFVSEGYWPAYWWRSRYFVGSRIIVPLLNTHNSELRLMAKKALDYIIEQQSSSGFWDNGLDKGIPCPLSTAYNAKLLAEVAQHSEKVTAAMEWLTGQQLDDGSWEGIPILQIPPPSVQSPNHYTKWRIGDVGVGSCSADGNRNYTTASVIAAISCYLNNFGIGVIWKD